MKLRLVLACSSAVVSLGLCATATPVLAAPAQATPSNVTVGCADTAALIAAVQQANANPDGGTIHLAKRCAYPFADDFADSGNALPAITGKVTIKGDDSTLIRTSGGTRFRLVQVSESGTLTLRGLTLTGGHVPGDGGGILNLGGVMRVEESTVAGNRSEVSGGGIANLRGGRATLVNSSVQVNTVTQSTSTGAAGGGIINELSTLTLIRTTVSGNSADQNGGGIINVGTLDVKDSRIENNVARTGSGGGLYNGTEGNPSRAVIKDTEIVENWAGLQGGGIQNNPSGTLEVYGGEIRLNKTGQDGGGLNNHGRATLSKTKVLKNQAADDGGGINNEPVLNSPAPVLTLKHALVKENRAGDDGGGVNNVAPGVAVNDKSEITRNRPTNCEGDVPNCNNH
ncbi:hypothetical protein [Streptomyces sp. NPDC047976]|uniref:hypothetical protein n=1 Tax=Streptomyces sp. NPDC047976 TaxID=3155746 RepID=UPI0034311ABE